MKVLYIEPNQFVSDMQIAKASKLRPDIEMLVAHNAEQALVIVGENPDILVVFLDSSMLNHIGAIELMKASLSNETEFIGVSSIGKYQRELNRHCSRTLTDKLDVVKAIRKTSWV